MMKKQPDKPASEAAFLDSYDPGDFDRPSVTVDVVVLTTRAGRLCVLVSQRGEHPWNICSILA